MRKYMRLIALVLVLVMGAAVVRTFRADTAKAGSVTIGESHVTYSSFMGANYTHNKRFVGYQLACGIDISQFNTVTNWAAVKNAGIDYVFIRAAGRYSESGRIYNDDRYAANMQGALAAGLQVGIYFFSQATTPAEAVEEANYLIAKAKGYNITLPLVMDYEYYANGRLSRSFSKDYATSLCKAFADTVRNAGYTPMIYASKNVFRDQMNASQVESFAQIWNAHYTSNTDYNTVDDPGCSYQVWQYTSTGSVPGISGNVDCDYFYLPPTNSGTPAPTTTIESSSEELEVPVLTETPLPAAFHGADESIDWSAATVTTGIQPGTTYGLFRQGLAEGTVCDITSAAGQARADSDRVSTGDVITFYTDAEKTTVANVSFVIVFGDLSGDGKVNLVDVLDMHQQVCETKTLNACAQMAADVNGDGKLGLTDILDMRQHICGTKKLAQTVTIKIGTELPASAGNAVSEQNAGGENVNEQASEELQESPAEEQIEAAEQNQPEEQVEETNEQ